MAKFNETHNVSLKKNFILSTAYQILLIITPFITAPYISRIIGADGIGIHSFTNSILAFFLMFANLGTASYAAREMSRNRDNREEMSKIFWEIFFMRVVTTCVCLIFWGFWVFFNQEYRLFYLILSIPLFCVMFDISWLYSGLEQFSYTVYRNSFFKILAIVLIFTLIRKKEDLVWYFVITAGVTLPSNLTLWIPLHKFVDKPVFKNLRFWVHFKETLIYFVPTIATSIYTILDKTLIGIITHSTAENGYYEQATKIIDMTKTVTFTALNAIMCSRMGYLFKEGKIEEMKKRLSQSMNYILFMGIGCCLGIIAIANRFVPLFFGEGYEPVVFIMQLLSPVIIFVGISNCLGTQYYNPARLRKQTNINVIVGAAVNLICNIIFIPRFQAVGAVMGTLIAEGVIAGMYLAFCDKMISIFKILLLAWRKIIAGSLMFLSIFFVNQFIQKDLFAVLIDIPLGVCVYLLVLLICRDEIFVWLKEIVLSRFNKKTN